jgi:DNA-binding transcriptional LysR family regulator
MELHQVRYFLALAQSLNFTRAAEECDVTQPALTKAVHKLEMELGGPLLYRERQFTQLTDLGRLVIPRMAKALEELGAAERLAGRFLSQEVASLRIGLAPSISISVVMAPLEGIVRQIPNLKVDLVEDGADRLVVGLLSGEVGAVLAGDGGALSERIERWPLFEERYVVLMAKQHPLAREAALPLARLADAVWLDRPGCDGLRRLKEAFLARGLQLRVQHRAYRNMDLQEMAAAGLGAMLAPQRVPRLPSLASRRILGDPLRRWTELLTVAGRRPSPALDAFIDILHRWDWNGGAETDRNRPEVSRRT